MTREEAINSLEFVRTACPDLDDSWKIANALDIGIKALEFMEWVTKELFSDEWEYNKEAFAELACRKLAKLGMVIRMGDEWELVESQESEE